MTSRPHDTDRILAVLGEAIEKIRSEAGMWDDDDLRDVANDLALLHGAVSAEAQRHDEDLAVDITVPPDQVGHVFHPASRDREPGWQGRALLRSVKREEYGAEVLAGEHRDDD